MTAREVAESVQRCQHQRATYVDGTGIEEFRVGPLREGILAALTIATAAVRGDARRCLDVGCGRQPLRPTLEGLGYSYESCDVIQNVDGTVDYVFPLDQPLPSSPPRARYALLVCTEVLEHVLNWQQAFANANELLQPGGAIVISTPFVYPLHEEPFDYWRPTHHALVRMCEREGWRIVHLDMQPDPWAVIGTVFHSLGADRSRAGVGAVLARAMWSVFKRVALMSARSAVVRRVLPLKGDLPMGTIVVAIKEGAGATTSPDGEPRSPS
jgi:SAM-dependent methyltransferase